MGLQDIAQDLAHGVESRVAAVGEALFDPVIRLGVTGLARAGKTVFITSLVSNLLDRGRMPQLRAASEGRIEAVWLQPQPDDTVPRFDYEAHRAALTGDAPRWPDSTRAVSELRLSFRIRPSGLFSGLRGVRKLHLDIIDYPGEWLLDLALLEIGYQDWATGVLNRFAKRPEAAGYMARVTATDAGQPLDEVQAQGLAADYTACLVALRAAGLSDVTPGRFLMPGDLAGSPALTFAPLPRPESPVRGSLWREMERRYDAYRSRVIKPFFRDHFSRIDRQVVLVDALGAIHAGPQAVEDMRRAMAGVLAAFRPGRSNPLTELLFGKKVDRILFAATRADHLHHSQHARLAAILAAMLREAKDRADYAGANTAAMALASLRATTEAEATQDGRRIEGVRGTLMDTGRQALMYAGDLPTDPGRLLSPAREGAERWLDADYSVMRFAPARMTLTPGEGLPHIRLDRAAEFLLGDQLT
ncbi:MAG: YcjX family protein [Gemmobacter sp.]|nr:YcjX family protein [Gemmobacter sp.]